MNTRETLFPILRLILLLAASFFTSLSEAGATRFERDSAEILCGTAIGLRYKAEVELPNAPDKYKHCSLSCVITLYCGPAESLEAGILKEVMDSLGMGDPDIEDLRADVRGIRAALRLRSSRNREDCYRACSLEYPVPGVSAFNGR